MNFVLKILRRSENSAMRQVLHNLIKTSTYTKRKMKYNWYRDLNDFLKKYECDGLFIFDPINVNAEAISTLKFNINKIVEMIRNKIVEEDVIRMQSSNSLSHFKYIKSHVKVEGFLNENMNWNLVKLGM